MLQIQGAGRILLPDGHTLRVGFDGQNGQPYTPIGRILVQDGDLAANDVSYQSISAWLKAHPDQAPGHHGAERPLRVPETARRPAGR